MKFVKKTYLVIEWSKLPNKYREIISEWNGFHNDCSLIYSNKSEFDVDSLQRGMSQVEEYWKDQVNTNGYTKDLDNFIKDWGLEFDVWLIEQNMDFSGVDDILIEVCW